jgi:hypothetical protein
MRFFAWPVDGLAVWAFAFLIFVIVAGPGELKPAIAGWGLAGLSLGLIYLLSMGRPRLLLIHGFLILRSGFSEQRWKWTEIDAIRLDYSRFNRPIVSFRAKDAARIYICGPWNIDEITLHTTLHLAKAQWGSTLETAPN